MGDACLALKLTECSLPIVQSLSHVRHFVTPWTAAHQAFLSFTNSQSMPSLMSIELVMPSNHLILCFPLLLLPSIFPSIKVFSNESALRIRWPEYWSFSFSISPSSEYAGLISFRIDCFDLCHNPPRNIWDGAEQFWVIITKLRNCYHLTCFTSQTFVCKDIALGLTSKDVREQKDLSSSLQADNFFPGIRKRQCLPPFPWSLLRRWLLMELTALHLMRRPLGALTLRVAVGERLPVICMALDSMFPAVWGFASFSALVGSGDSDLDDVTQSHCSWSLFLVWGRVLLGAGPMFCWTPEHS